FSMAEGETSQSKAEFVPQEVPPLPVPPLGTYEELNRKCKDVFPMCFEGLKFAVQKGLSPHFQVSHTLSISQVNTGYRFGATFVGDSHITANEAYPVILADTDASGNTSATILHQFKNNIRMKLQSQIQDSQLAAAQCSLEHRGKLSTATLTMANIDLVNESGVIAGQFLRRITDRFDVGAELVYHYSKQIPGRQMSNLSYAARYTHPHWIGSVVLGKGLTSLNMSYYHKQHPNLSFGVDFETNFRTQESLTTLAYQAELPEEGVVMRASIDTNWTVGAVIEKRLSQFLPFTLALSGMLNHVKSAGRFGIGFIIG
ncbi:hypothetical protein PMAYCL1PPCAC_30776, partial [Pristionchus mayeri]